MALILAVDDTAMNLRLLAKMLEFGGHTVVTANNGAEALEVAERVRPDLILMDLDMPIMDGWTATEHLKATPHLAAIPVVAVTALTLVHEHQRAIQAGCATTMTKPINYSSLLKLVQTYCPTE